MTLLFGIKESDLQGPLPQFQATSFAKTDFRKLINTINLALGENMLADKVLDSVFEKMWPDLEHEVDAVRKETETNRNIEPRTDRSILEELLGLARAGIYSSTPHYDTVIRSILYSPISDLKLALKTKSSLKDENIYYIGDLIPRTELELRTSPYFSQKQILEIKDTLAHRGLALGIPLDNWPPNRT
ncbi:MAG: hypothetical protein JKX83_05705 [Pseudomonadales bacterium]|nr:hypothetical protein [Pseudomonadales bacterium]